MSLSPIVKADWALGRAPPPPPKFGHLNNAFQTPLVISRVKRARTEAVSPTNGRSPGPSPTKVKDREGSAQRSSPAPDEEIMEDFMDAHWFNGDADEPMIMDEVEVVDNKAEVCLRNPMRSCTG